MEGVGSVISTVWDATGRIARGTVSCVTALAGLTGAGASDAQDPQFHLNTQYLIPRCFEPTELNNHITDPARYGSFASSFRNEYENKPGSMIRWRSGFLPADRTASVPSRSRFASPSVLISLTEERFKGEEPRTKPEKGEGDGAKRLILSLSTYLSDAMGWQRGEEELISPFQHGGGYSSQGGKFKPHPPKDSVRAISSLARRMRFNLQTGSKGSSSNLNLNYGPVNTAGLILADIELNAEYIMCALATHRCNSAEIQGRWAGGTFPLPRTDFSQRSGAKFTDDLPESFLGVSKPGESKAQEEEEEEQAQVKDTQAEDVPCASSEVATDKGESVQVPNDREEEPSQIIENDLPFNPDQKGSVEDEATLTCSDPDTATGVKEDPSHSQGDVAVESDVLQEPRYPELSQEQGLSESLSEVTGSEVGEARSLAEEEGGRIPGEGTPSTDGGSSREADEPDKGAEGTDGAKGDPDLDDRKSNGASPEVGDAGAH